MRLCLPLLAAMAIGLVVGPLRAPAEPPAAAPDFKKDVLPILEAKCIRCHGGRSRGGKLDMRTPEAMLAGGNSGPAYKPGNATKSLMIELIHFNEMPPRKEQPRVSKEELELLKAWVNAAAPAAKEQRPPQLYR